MSIISVKNLTFCYEGSYDNVFEDVSFQLDTDWRLGFTGRNGRGKTTFLKLLTGAYEYRGSITASVSFEYFPFAVVDPRRSTAEILDEITAGGYWWQLERELQLLGVDPEVLERTFDTLSGGERTKALIAALFCKENNFLLIDEPTNHLDAEGRELLARYLKSKSGFIIVSHDREFLDASVDHILSINKANIEVQRGNFSSWYENKRLRDTYELAENTRLSRDIIRLTDSARQKAAWSDNLEASKIGGHASDRGRIGHQAAKMMKRSKNLERRNNRAITEKSKLLHNLEDPETLKIQPLTFHSRRLAEARDLALFYGDKQVFADLSFELEQGDRIALQGKNGSGKSSLVKLLCGDPLEHTGQFFRALGLEISYVGQDISGLSGGLDAYAARYGINISVFYAMLRKLGLSRVQFEKDLSDYSDGQKKKVLLARSLSEQAHLYVWDEPLNYIDVLSRIQIEQLILQYRPTLLFVEHDSAFCKAVATKTLSL